MKCEEISYRTCENQVGTVKISGNTQGAVPISLYRRYEYPLVGSSAIHFDTVQEAKEVANAILEVAEELS